MVGFLSWAKKHPVWIENNYSQKIYPSIFNGRRWFFQAFEISIGDIFYLLFFALLGHAIIQLILKKQRFVIEGIISCVCVLFLWFEVSWGLNYYRLPLSKKMELYNDQCAEDDLYSLTYFLAQQSNQLHQLLSSTSEQEVKIPYSPLKLVDTLAYTGKSSGITTNAKESCYSLPLLYAGFSGYLNPFTLEAQINAKIPLLQLPVTIAHEMAHQEGYAAENEANFIGFARTFHHPDPYIRYASHLFGFRQCYAALKRSDPDLANTVLKTLSPGIRADFTKMYLFWKKYKNPLQPYAKKSYDRFLKANGQTHGIESYSKVVRLMLQSYSQNPERPFQLGNNL